MSEQANRGRLVLWLVGFVVVFGGVSWIVTGGLGPHGALSTHSHPVTFAPGSTPTPLACQSNELEVVGIFSECATAVPATATCSVSRDTLDALLRFAGSNQAFLFYVELKGTYTGRSKYDLPPWQFGLGINDVPKVAVRQYTTGAFWQSVAGVLTVTGGDGRSGTVNAILQASTGAPDLSGPTLTVVGPWSCS